MFTYCIFQYILCVMILSLEALKHSPANYSSRFRQWNKTIRSKLALRTECVTPRSSRFMLGGLKYINWQATGSTFRYYIRYNVVRSLDGRLVWCLHQVANILNSEPCTPLHLEWYNLVTFEDKRCYLQSHNLGKHQARHTCTRTHWAGFHIPLLPISYMFQKCSLMHWLEVEWKQHFWTGLGHR